MIVTSTTYQGTPTMADIEYFYSAHSAFAYFGSARLMEIARTADSQIIHKPIDLNRVVEANGPGWTGSLTPARLVASSFRASVKRDLRLPSGSV